MTYLKELVVWFVFVLYSVTCSKNKHLQQVDQPEQNKGCLEKGSVQECLERELIQELNRMLNKKSLSLAEGIDFVQTSQLNRTRPNASWNSSGNFNDVLWDKISQFVTTRSVRIHFPGYYEGRGKKVQKQYIALGLLIAAIIATLKFQALSFVVGKAFMISNIAFLAAGFLAFKLLLPATMRSAKPTVVYVEPSAATLRD